MPELPEVETIRGSLEPLLLGRRITDARVYLPKALKGANPEELREAIVGQSVTGLERRGKYLVVRLDSGLSLVFHLRMTGRLSVKAPEEPLAKQTTLVLSLDNGGEFRFEDTRKFGTVDLLRAGAPHTMARLGPEPLDEGWSVEELVRKAGKKRTTIKAALLDQEVVAGLGNIYVDEALHRAGIHPARPATGIAPEEWMRLYEAIRYVLTEGIAYRGTTRRDYRDAYGRSGEYQNRLRVYGRQGLPCATCGRTIERRRVAGRGTHFCPICQPSREDDEA